MIRYYIVVLDDAIIVPAVKLFNMFLYLCNEPPFLNKINYVQKFGSFQNKTLFEKLDILQQEFIKDIAFKHKFTFQGNMKH